LNLKNEMSLIFKLYGKHVIGRLISANPSARPKHKKSI